MRTWDLALEFQEFRGRRQLKAILLVLFLGVCACSYRVGRLPSGGEGLSLGPVVSHSAMPEAESAAARALASRLAREDADSGATPVELTLLEAGDRLIGPQGLQRRLDLAIALRAGEARVEARGSRLFLGSDAAGENAVRRREVLDSLSQELVDEALPRLSARLREGVDAP